MNEIELKEIGLIANYWLKSYSSFLVSMGVALNKLPSREGIDKNVIKANKFTNRKGKPLCFRELGTTLDHNRYLSVKQGRNSEP